MLPRAPARRNTHRWGYTDSNVHHFDIVSRLQGAFVLGVISYAARTIPQPKSVWGRWLIGIFQFAVTNADKGQQALAGPPVSTSPAESIKP
jgi:hypothetical protein